MVIHRVLFVCLGNFCRSPLAEGALRALVEAEDDAAGFVIDSAGTAGWHAGNPPDARAVAAARARGIDIRGQRSRQVRREDFEDFDLLLAMDDSNARCLARLAPGDRAYKVRLFLDYAPEQELREVPDPYYGGEEGFGRVLDLVEAAARGLLRSLRTAVPHAPSPSCKE